MSQPTSSETFAPQMGVPQPENTPTPILDSLPYWKGGIKELKSFRGPFTRNLVCLFFPRWAHHCKRWQ